ncbi:MAG: hypothetical protein KGS72_20970 [Cyanobacteria bacterium REEB67]|nr:hypothetical protein [Cyanobacteria bacterium REEB67]
MTAELPNLHDIVKEGEHFMQAAWGAAHKLVADTQTHPAAKPAEAATPKAEAHKPEAHKPEAHKPEAAAPKTEADKTEAAAPKAEAAAPKTGASLEDREKAIGNSSVTAGDINDALESGMGNAAKFLASAAGSAFDFLPGVAIVDLGAKAVVNAVMPQSPEHEKASAEKQNQNDSTALKKNFAQVTTTDKKGGLIDWLKESGCNTGDSCKVDRSKNPMDFLNTPITRAKDSEIFKTGQSDNAFQNRINRDEWASIFAIINKTDGTNYNVKDWQDESTGTQGRDSGTTTNCADGKIHRDANGKIDWEKHGDITTKRSADGINVSVNGKTHEISVTDDKGQNLLKKGADGKWHFDIPGGSGKSWVEIDAKTGKATIYDNGRPISAKIANGRFEEEVGNTHITASDANILPNLGSTVGSTFNGLFSGKARIERGADGIKIDAADGSGMWVGKDGSAGMRLADGTTIAMDAAKKITVYHKDGTHEEMSKEQLAKMLGTDRARAIKAVVEQLRHFNETGKLTDGNGSEITASNTNGSKTPTLAAKTADVTVTSTGSAPMVIAAAHSGLKQEVNLQANTIDVIGADGKKAGTIGSENGHTTYTTASYKFDGSEAILNDGTQITDHGAVFRDGTNIHDDGTIEKNGVTFDSAGEVTSYRASKSSGATGGRSETSVENIARAQVSEAESIASSIRSRAASGYVTASDIAALQSSLASLSVLVCSLAQFPDAGVLAGAVMAEDDVAGSMELALGALHTNHSEVKAAA